jgi:hypothetical protein
VKIEAVKTLMVSAHRRVEVSDGPLVGDRRKFRVERISVAYLWSPEGHRWGVQHIEVSGPVQKKDGTDSVLSATAVVWLRNVDEPWSDFRRIAANLAPLGDPQLPGVLDA